MVRYTQHEVKWIFRRLWIAVVLSGIYCVSLYAGDGAIYIQDEVEIISNQSLTSSAGHTPTSFVPVGKSKSVSIEYWITGLKGGSGNIVTFTPLYESQNNGTVANSIGYALEAKTPAADEIIITEGTDEEVGIAFIAETNFPQGMSQMTFNATTDQAAPTLKVTVTVVPR